MQLEGIRRHFYLENSRRGSSSVRSVCCIANFMGLSLLDIDIQKVQGTSYEGKVKKTVHAYCRTNFKSFTSKAAEFTWLAAVLMTVSSWKVHRSASNL